MSDTEDTATGNLPELTVSELAGAVKRTVETAFGRVRVRGEITEMKTYASGHTYMALKDETAKIRAIIWRGNASRIGLKPENGVEVIATGRVTTYAERSEYQLIIERLDYAGEGALLARIERLRKKLTEEGLFETTRKRKLPMLPRIVGVVSSAQGAVIQDIKTTIARRFPSRIILWPVAVQGEAAASQIAAAIEGFGSLPIKGSIPRPDVLIVARGGGSLEDLMAFNDEAVVRATAACPIPLISAVGHETDTTLIDFASDRRAPTPTAAAELAVPDRVALTADLAQSDARLAGALTRITQSVRLRLDRAASALPDLPTLLGTTRQRLDDRSERLILALPNLVAGKRVQAQAIAARLVHPREIIAARGHALALLAHRLAAPPSNMLRENRLRLDSLGARLESLSYNATLARGFIMATTTSGETVTTRQKAARLGRFTLHFADGKLSVRTEMRKSPPEQPSLDL